MEILDISQNDDLQAMARKCNANFKQVAFASLQSVKQQSRMDDERISSAMAAAADKLINETLPQQIAAKVDALDIPSIVGEKVGEYDIPGLVAQEAAKIECAPPVGGYELSSGDPGELYPSTSWAYIGTVGLADQDGEASEDEYQLKVYKRTE